MQAKDITSEIVLHVICMYKCTCAVSYNLYMIVCEPYANAGKLACTCTCTCQITLDVGRVLLYSFSNCDFFSSPFQYETQNESLMADLREAELKKEELQHTLVSFNEQLVTLKTREQGLLDSEMDR